MNSGKLVKEAGSGGLDIVNSIISTLQGHLGEARSYLDKGDAIHASENIYKVVENVLRHWLSTIKSQDLKKYRGRVYINVVSWKCYKNIS